MGLVIVNLIENLARGVPYHEMSGVWKKRMAYGGQERWPGIADVQDVALSTLQQVWLRRKAVI